MGRYLSKDIAFLTIASVLHVFEVVPTVDESGWPIDPTPELSIGFIRSVYLTQKHMRRTDDVHIIAIRNVCQLSGHFRRQRKNSSVRQHDRNIVSDAQYWRR